MTDLDDLDPDNLTDAQIVRLLADPGTGETPPRIIGTYPRDALFDPPPELKVPVLGGAAALALAAALAALGIYLHRRDWPRAAACAAIAAAGAAALRVILR